MTVVKSISQGLAKNALAATLDGQMVDLNSPICQDASFAALTFDDEKGQRVLRHSSSHILAEAVQRLFPGTKLGIGPAIQDGFYYDFDSEHTFTPEDLVIIEKEMAKIKKNLESRKANKAKIVDQRLDQMTGEGSGW